MSGTLERTGKAVPRQQGLRTRCCCGYMLQLWFIGGNTAARHCHTTAAVTASNPQSSQGAPSPLPELDGAGDSWLCWLIKLLLELPFCIVTPVWVLRPPPGWVGCFAGPARLGLDSCCYLWHSRCLSCTGVSSTEASRSK